MSNNGFNGLFRQIYLNGGKDTFTPEQWSKYKITQEDLDDYPNAKLGKDIQDSPLFQALRETDEEFKLAPGGIADFIPEGVKLMSMIKPNIKFHGTLMKIDLGEEEE